MTEPRGVRATFSRRSDGGFDVRVSHERAGDVFWMRDELRRSVGVVFADERVRTHDGAECFCEGTLRGEG